MIILTELSRAIRINTGHFAIFSDIKETLFYTNWAI